MADGGLPPGEFFTLRPILESAAQRQGRRSRELSNMDAAVLLEQQKAQQKKKAKDTKTSADQFLHAAELPPRRYTFRLQRTLYSGPTARKDVEEKERARRV